MAKNKTIFDFFGKSPLNKSNVEQSPKALSSSNSKSPKTSTPKLSKANGSSKKRNASMSSTNNDSLLSSDEKKELNGNSNKKRRRIVVDSDSDSDDNYRPDKGELSEDDAIDESGNYSSESEEESPKPKKTKKDKPLKLTQKSPKSSKGNSKLNTSTNESFSATNTSSVDLSNKEWLHLTLDWLKDDKLRDRQKRLKSYPDYDPKTLHVPDSFFKNVTPAHKQWWEMKSNHFDTVLFFKVGKFYELFHMDAVIGVKELGLIYMKGDYAHSGFPEISYGRFSDALVQRGYNVARVEQTETPAMMEERCRKMTKTSKFDKVVSREICQITTKGTRVFGCIDGESLAANNNFLLAVTERVSIDSTCECEYGVCFIDTSVGKFHVGQFSDDRHCSRLRTLMAHYPIVELLYERNTVSKRTCQMFNSSHGNGMKVPMNSQFWEPSKILKYLTQQVYKSVVIEDNCELNLPKVLMDMIDENDVLQESPKKEYELAVRAMGACIWHFKECLIDEQLLTMKLFEHYIPVDFENCTATSDRTFHAQHMILDGITLRNLEILENNCNEVLDGTLIDTMDFCSTNFGKRLFRYWMCSPLCNIKNIHDRLDAVEDLEKISHVVEEIKPMLQKIPDLERLLAKIHAQGLKRSLDHPDSRAIFYEEDVYSKRKILNFLSTLAGFENCISVVNLVQPFLHEFTSKSLTQCVKSCVDGGMFPSMQETLDYFDNAFDHEKAKKDRCIIPSKGIDFEYDSSMLNIKEIENKLDKYLIEQKKKFQCQVSYFGSAKNRFQLEVPEHAAKHANSQYEIHSHRKGFKRFYTSEIKTWLSELIIAEEQRDAALLDIMRRIFAKFDEDYTNWKSAVQCIAILDCLISLMLYKKSSQVTMCRPEILLPNANRKPFIRIIEGRHPSLLKCFTGDTYIPNGVYLGPIQESSNDTANLGGNVVLVTGPNMGGKSTLMRQTGLLAIMAQMGSYVPAEKCILTPIDRVFTRLGASDRITEGESTFFVEVRETSSILQHATLDSLVLIDELGRGTATYDGTAIACSVVQDLASRIQCRTLFSTHYHSLVEDFAPYPNIGSGHMSCMVEDDDNHPALENITFLYKFVDGVCPKSYGFNVAYLAGIAENVVQRGFKKSREFEKTTKYKNMLKTLFSADESNILQTLKEAEDLVKLFENVKVQD